MTLGTLSRPVEHVMQVKEIRFLRNGSKYSKPEVLRMSRFPNCSAALEALAKGLDAETCHSFVKIRQVVMCKAWHDARAEPFTPETFQHRVSNAWQEVEKACAAHGGTRPEYGFLPGQVTRSIPAEAYAQAITQAKEIKKNGVHAGVIAEASDGTVTICLHDKCEVLRKGEQFENLTVMLKIYGFDIED